MAEREPDDHKAGRSPPSPSPSPSSSSDSDDDRQARVQDASAEPFRAGERAARGSPAAEYRAEMAALRGFLTRAPKRGAVPLQCFVERDRQGLQRLRPVYRLFRSDGRQFLLCAQRRAGSRTANYLLTMAARPCASRRDALTVGKLRGNWAGSEFLVFDDGLSPRKTALASSVRCVLAAVELSYDEAGPGRVGVRIPRVQASGSPAPSRDRAGGGLDAGGCLDADDCLRLRNKRPRFDAKTGGHVLDFGGRVTMPSVKNFQLQSHDDAETALQFGRVSCHPRAQCACHRDTFNMDVQYPLNPLQAFAICLAVLDAKGADSRLYDSVAKLARKKR